MFDIGFAEILFVSVIALLVLGPDKLPTALRTCGLWIGRLKRTVTSIQREISEELRVDELRKAAEMSKEQLHKGMNSIKEPVESATSEVVSTGTQLEEVAASFDKKTEHTEGTR